MTARDFEIYAPDATFEDPLMCAHGYECRWLSKEFKILLTFAWLFSSFFFLKRMVIV